MSELGLTLVALAVQVTLLALGVLAVSARHRAGSSTGTDSLAVLAVLTLTALAFVPIPSWGGLLGGASPPDLPAPSGSDAPADPASEAKAPGHVSRPTTGGFEPLRLLARLRANDTGTHRSGLGAAALIAIGMLSATAIALVRLGMGFVAVCALVRRAQPVNDCELLGVVETLCRELGIRRRVSVRETPSLAGAATAGWLRPVVLLGVEWRTWTPTDLRAALAHELSHIATGDYPRRLLARLAAALHAYHPLVRWLVGRVHLNQELAADARAACCVGGRSVYVRSLAAAALRADDAAAGAAPAFLSNTGTLMRRVAMLRITEDASTPRRAGRWGVVLVLALGVAAVGLRIAPPDVLAEPATTTTPTKADRPPLDVSMVLPTDDPDCYGVYALRVGEAFRARELAKLTAFLNQALRTGKALGQDLGLMLDLPVEDIEQIAGRLTLRVEDKPPPNSKFMLSGVAIRAARDFDWLKQLKAWFGEVAERKHNGRTYYRVKKSGRRIEMLFGISGDSTFYIPDSRTLIHDSEANICKLIDIQSARERRPAQPDGWEGFSRGFLAVSFDDPEHRLAKKTAAAPMDPKNDETNRQRDQLVRFLRQTQRFVIGFDAAEGCKLEMRFTCDDANAAADVAKLFEEGVRLVGEIPKAEAPKEEHSNLERSVESIEIAMLRSVTVKRDGGVLSVKADAASGVKAVLKAIAESIPPGK